MTTSASTVEGSAPRWCSFLRRCFDCAFVGKLAQHGFELGAQRVLQAEGAGDLFGTDLARLLPDEGEDVGLGRQGGGGSFSGFGQ